MKKSFKAIFTVAALASMCLMTSTVLLAGTEGGSTEIGGDNKDDPTKAYCIYQTMSHCKDAGLNYACKISQTAELCRRHACCQPF